MKKSKIFLSLAILLNFYSTLLTVTKGSNTAVSVEANFTFPSADTDNIMLGFGWFKNGFSLADAATTCTFDDVFPVSGNVDLKGGTLYLKQDLLFNNITDILGWGIIQGNEQQVDFSSSITALPPNADSFDSTKLFLNSDLVIEGAITFKGQCLLQGVGNTITLGNSGEIIVEDGAHLVIKNLLIDGIKDKNIRCLGSNSIITLVQSDWLLDGDYTFSHGSLEFFKNNTITGNYKFVLDTPYTSTVRIHSSLLITGNMNWQVGRKNDVEPLYFDDSTAQLRFDNSTFSVRSTGIRLTRGTLVTSRDTALEVDSTSTVNGFELGDGTAAGDMILEFSPGSSNRVVKGAMIYNTSQSIRSRSDTARFVREKDSILQIKQDVTFSDLTIEADPLAQLIVDDGVTISYNKANLVIPQGKFLIIGSRFDDFTTLLAGNQIIDILNGTLPLATMVTGSGNIIQGSGNVGGPIILSDSASELTYDMIGNILTNITLGGGTFILGDDINLANGVLFNGPGTIDLNNSDVFFGSDDLVWTSSVSWDGVGAINLNSSLTLKGTWTIKNQFEIIGNGNTLDLKDGGEIIVEDGAHFVIKNLVIDGIQDKNIRCLGDSSVITFISSDWLLDSDYTFSHGSFEFLQDNKIIGDYAFVLDTPRTSTVCAHGSLLITGNITWRVGRKNGVEPLYFDDSTAQLRFDNSIFSVRSTGISLTRGTLVTSRDSALEVDSTSTVNGFELGDGTAAGDMILEFSPGSSNRLVKGAMIYNTSQSIRSRSDTARFIREKDSILQVKQDVTFSDLTVEADPLAQLIVDDGVTISYDDANLVIPQGTFFVTGSRFDDFTTLLVENQMIDILNGTLPLATMVTGSGNIIQGNGNVGGPIILSDSSSELTYDIVGNILSNITLNNGTLKLDSDLICASGVLLNGSGTVNLVSNVVRFGPTDLIWGNPLIWEGNGGKIEMNANIALSDTWTFSNKCEINGKGYLLDLGTTGSIVVETNSQLILKNVIIQGVHNSNVRCLDDTASLILDNVIWIQCGHNNFLNGAFQIKNKVKMKGNGTIFAYQTSKTSTIRSSSELKLDNGFTFSYDAITLASKDLLEFADDSAMLTLNGATLHATVTGMNLTGGILNVLNNSTLASEVVTSTITLNVLIDEGITFGSGTQIDDCEVAIFNATELELTQGTLNYKNVLNNSFNLGSDGSVIRMNSNTMFKLFETLNFDTGLLVFGDNTTLSVLVGKSITGSIVPLGRLLRRKFKI